MCRSTVLAYVNKIPPREPCNASLFFGDECALQYK